MGCEPWLPRLEIGVELGVLGNSSNKEKFQSILSSTYAV